MHIGNTFAFDSLRTLEACDVFVSMDHVAEGVGNAHYQLADTWWKGG